MASLNHAVLSVGPSCLGGVISRGTAPSSLLLLMSAVPTNRVKEAFFLDSLGRLSLGAAQTCWEPAPPSAGARRPHLLYLLGNLCRNLLCVHTPPAGRPL